MNVVYLIIIGLIGGLIGGMGMGGGTLLIPMLTIFMNLEQQIAQSINLIAFIPMAIVALIVHTKNKLVDYKKSILILILGVIFSILGSYLVKGVESENLKIYFGIFLIVLGVFQFISIWIFPSSQKEK